MCPPPGGPSRWNPFCYSPGPTGRNDVADPDCHDITDAGKPDYYSPWEGNYDRRGNLVGVKRNCLQADREYSLHYRRRGEILDLAGKGNPGLWLNAESQNPKSQVTIKFDPQKTTKAIEYIRQKIDEDLPVSAGVNVAGQNSGRINGAIVDHWLAIDGYRVNGQGAVTELFGTDNAAGAGASLGEYRIRFEVRADGSIVKPAVPGLSAGQSHADIQLEYQLAMIQVYVKDLHKDKDGKLEVNGTAVEAWREGQKKPFSMKEWEKISPNRVPKRLR